MMLRVLQVVRYICQLLIEPSQKVPAPVLKDPFPLSMGRDRGLRTPA